MKTVAVALIALLLSACASAPPLPPPTGLFHDELFKPASEPIVPAQALAVSDQMRQYIATKIVRGQHADDTRQRLINVLYRQGELKLEYDAATTRTASQAFEARSGNCLALVMMTAAFAKELGLGVRYQAALGDEAWDRADDIYIAVGHVNLTLNDRPPMEGIGFMPPDPMTIDFVPGQRTQRMRMIQEATVVAMYLNNRAVESLTRGQVDDAYWYAREAIRTDPQLSMAYLTLGVIYRNHQHPELAEAVLSRLAEREPGNTKVMSNRVLVLHDLNRHAEANALTQQLAQLDPHPPFSYFRQGMAAMREQRYTAARDLFAKEVDRAPYHHEFQFWLAVAYYQLHDPARAREHLTRAMEISTTRRDHDLYASKLDKLKGEIAPQ